MTKQEEYYIFRHFISQPKYKVPIDFDNEVKWSDPYPLQLYFPDYNSGQAFFLSGGLDSSYLAAKMKAKHTYSAHFIDKEFDETEWAELVAKHIGSKHTVVDITPFEYKASMEYLIRQKGEPLHPNEPAMYIVAKKMRQDGFSCAVSGEGADDLFGGYSDLLENEEKYMKNKESFLRRYAYVYKDVRIPFRKWKRWGMYRFLLTVHTPGLIQRAQNACQSAGIAVRFPYLNNGIPQRIWHDYRGRGLNNKEELKTIAERLLPKEVIYRKKIGFPIPMESWFGSYEEFAQLNLMIWESIDAG